MKKIHIALQPDQKIFLTSDLHLGHKNVLKFCNRPFLDIKDMHRGLVENWNNVVSPTDIVFDLGDMFWWDSRHEVKKFVEKLNGTIYKVPGNHDMDIKKLFELCDPEKVVLLEDVTTVWVSNMIPNRPSKQLEFVVCHYPLATWPHRPNTIQMFGHIHSGPRVEANLDIPGKDLILNERQYDVGVDNNNYTPIELREVYKKLRIDYEKA